MNLDDQATLDNELDSFFQEWAPEEARRRPYRGAKEIQTKLSKLLKEKVVLIGSGRTDTGVHAIEQSAHFDCKKEIQNLDKLLKSINHFINDKGISILAIKKRSLKFKFLAQEHSQKKRLFFC